MKTAIAFGIFDGLHAGHRAVLEATAGCKRTAVTFSDPPKFDDKDHRQLMSLEDRKKGLMELGMDAVECLSFEYYKDMSPEEFLDFITEHFEVCKIACGFNFRFGKNASGNTETMKKYCEEKGIELICADPVKKDGKVISSSLIRDYISKGDISAANELLLYPFGFKAEVLSGDKRGRQIGFPTINQLIPRELVIPKLGVYKSSVILNGKKYRSVTNIGHRPTYKTENVTAETHIMDFSGDIYGKEVTVLPENFLREEKKFSSLDELKKAIKNDCSEVIK